jgi:hypothetical protein
VAAPLCLGLRAVMTRFEQNESACLTFPLLSRSVIVPQYGILIVIGQRPVPCSHRQPLFSIPTFSPKSVDG